MRVRILYLGGSRTQAGCKEETLVLPDSARVQDASTEVCSRHPKLAALVASCRWARNLEFAATNESLTDGDELALLPPVSGGSAVAQLTEDVIDPKTVIERVAGPDAGAVVVFVGTVRNQTRDQAITALDYEAYGPMALRQLERICQDLAPLARVSIAHRTGHLPVGETSVVIAAAAAHRDAAFTACRTAIERIKVDVPIWKQEHTADGQTWVGWGGG